MPTLDIHPSYGWDCLSCGRPSFQRLPVRSFRWDDPQDRKLLIEAFDLDQLATIKLKNPGETIRIHATPDYLICEHCGIEFRLVEDRNPPLAVPVPEFEIGMTPVAS